MAVASDHDDATKICRHWSTGNSISTMLIRFYGSDRAIPSSNLDLHYAHCSRNLEKCKICGDMVPKKHAEEHYSSTHAPVSCSLCNEMMEPENLALHKGEKCPQRIATCDYCEFPLPAADLSEHQEVCGNRTELCPLCNRYIRLRERIAHEVSCNGVSNTTAETSRATREVEGAPAPAPRRRPRPPPHSRTLVFAVAITGIAILLGSYLFQTKP